MLQLNFLLLSVLYVSFLKHLLVHLLSPPYHLLRDACCWLTSSQETLLVCDRSCGCPSHGLL